MVKKLLMVLMLLTFCIPVFAQENPGTVRFQTAGCVLTRSDAEPEYNMRFGISKGLLSGESKSALYSIAFGKYGDGVKGADLEFAFFPSKPTGSGVRFFFVAGSNYTVIETEIDPITYLQFASGGGLYWDFSPTAALWFAFKLEQSEDLQTVHAGIGLSTALF